MKSAALTALEAESRRESLAPPYAPHLMSLKNPRFTPTISTVVSAAENLQELGGDSGMEGNAMEGSSVLGGGMRGGDVVWGALRESDKSEDYSNDFVDMTTDMQGHPPHLL